MSNLALYRVHRPLKFDDVIGQETIITTLKQAIVTKSVAHAYLFSGTRGTGKTSVAKILARAVNCTSPDLAPPCNICEVCVADLEDRLVDVIELDAASNNNVDTIRRICDEAVFAPTLARYKVYIIDETHMLSKGAFNALLKTLEEPPSHVIFILATTDPQSIPATIISRCQRYEFHRISTGDMFNLLEDIAKEHSIQIDKDALETICLLSDGAMRDAISLLDQCQTSYPNGVNKNQVRELVGQTDDQKLFDLFAALLNQDYAQTLTLFNTLVEKGRDYTRFTLDLAQYIRDAILFKQFGKPMPFLILSDEKRDQLKQLTQNMEESELIQLLDRLAHLISEVKKSTQPKLLIESFFLTIHTDSKIEIQVKPEKKTAKVKLQEKIVQPPVEEPVIVNEPVFMDEPIFENVMDIPEPIFENTVEVPEVIEAPTPPPVVEIKEEKESPSVEQPNMQNKWAEVLTYMTANGMRFSQICLKKITPRFLDNSIHLYYKENEYKIYAEAKSGKIHQDLKQVLNALSLAPESLVLHYDESIPNKQEEHKTINDWVNTVVNVSQDLNIKVEKT